MRVGEPLNPRYEACGFFPDEIVGRRRDLTDGQKWLYSRMVRWARLEDGNRPNERAGEVWRAHSTIAEELGKSDKQVGRDLEKLESVCLLGHRQRDGRKSNTYYFLFHAEFEQTPASVQIGAECGFEGTPMSVQTASSEAAGTNLNGHPRPVTQHLNGHPRPPNPKDLNHKWNPSSSSPECDGRVVEPVEASPATTTSENVNAKSQPEPWEWSPGDRLEFSRELQAINDSLLEPTEDVMRYVLAHMQGPEDARLWVWSLKARGVKRNKPGWGLLRDEARKWDSDRVSVRRQVDAQRAVMEAEARANAEAEAAASSENEVAMKIYEQQQREQQEFIDAAEARGWPRDSKSICLFCYGFGRCDVATGAICDCESGRKLKLKLEQDRARVRNNPAAPKPTDSPPTREPPAVREPARHRHGAQMVSR